MNAENERIELVDNQHSIELFSQSQFNYFYWTQLANIIREINILIKGMQISN